MISFRITITSQPSQHLKECNDIKAELDQIPVYQLNKYRNVRACNAHQYTPKTRSIVLLQSSAKTITCLYLKYSLNSS